MGMQAISIKQGDSQVLNFPLVIESSININALTAKFIVYDLDQSGNTTVMLRYDNVQVTPTPSATSTVNALVSIPLTQSDTNMPVKQYRYGLRLQSNAYSSSIIDNEIFDITANIIAGIS